MFGLKSATELMARKPKVGHTAVLIGSLVDGKISYLEYIIYIYKYENLILNTNNLRISLTLIQSILLISNKCIYPTFDKMCHILMPL